MLQINAVIDTNCLKNAFKCSCTIYLMKSNYVYKKNIIFEKIYWFF